MSGPIRTRGSRRTTPIAQTRSISADLRAWMLQKSAPMTVHYGRELRLAGRALPGPRVERVRTRHGAVRCLIWDGVDAAAGATYVHLHGGAWVMRHPRMDEWWARYVVATTGVGVVLVDYDVAPQVRYPVAHEQVHDVLAHLGRAGTPLAVGGFSAGGNLAAAACLLARDSGTPLPVLQLLGAPSLDLTESYEDKRPTGASMLGPALLDLVRATYFRDAGRRDEPYASPARAASLAGLPPAYVVTGERDLLRREGDAYAARLADAGVPVDHHVVPGADHYFLDASNAPHEMGRMAAALLDALRPDRHRAGL